MATTFEQQLLAAIGAPDTFQNNTALSAWEDSEGVPPQDYNPLAITDPTNRYPHAGIVSINGGNPVYAFPDQATGVRATADFLNAGSYQPILAAFRNNAGYAAIYRAINQSPWCSGCQGGRYPTRLFQFAYDASQGSGVSTPGQGLPTRQAQQDAIDARKAANPCALSLPVVGCIIHRDTLRKAGGVALVASGGLVMLIGTYIIISRFGPTKALAGAVGGVPGVRRGASSASSEAPFREGEAPDSAANRRLYQRRLRAQRTERDEGERESARTAVIREREGARQRALEDRYDQAS